MPAARRTKDSNISHREPLALVRATHLSQHRLDPLPKPRLLRVASFAMEFSFLSGFCDGFGALRGKKVTCESRNIRCIHLNRSRIS